MIEQNKLEATEHAVDFENFKAPKIEDLPTVVGHRLLVIPVMAKEKTKSGIYLPDTVRNDVDSLTNCGYVAAMGEECFDRDEGFKSDWCKVGDWVCFGKHMGRRFTYKGTPMRLLEDKHIFMRVNSPEDIDSLYNYSSGF